MSPGAAISKPHPLRKSATRWLHPQRVFKVWPKTSLCVFFFFFLIASPLPLGPPRNDLLRLSLDLLIQSDLTYYIGGSITHHWGVWTFQGELGDSPQDV